MFYFLILLIAALSVESKSIENDEGNKKCYGLSLSSGKGLGPYQAGAISALLNEFKNNHTY
jgi:hypothetical protein